MMEKFLNALRFLGNSLQSPLLLLIRLYWGYQFMQAGYGKLLDLEKVSSFFHTLDIPFPFWNALLVAVTELVGGILLGLGFFARLIALPLFFLLSVAYLTTGGTSLLSLFTAFDPLPFFQHSAFLFIYAVSLIFCFGPGKLSLDYWLSKKNEMP